MKLLIRMFALFLLIAGYSCEKNDDSPEEQLHEATQTGANTAGCLVDGEVLLPRGRSLNSGSVLKAQYILRDDTYIFGLGIVDNNVYVNISYRGQALIEGNIYTIENASSNSASGTYVRGVSGSENGFITNENSTGKISINRIDETNRIISGTFWFDAENGNGDIAEVRNGRFDVRYSR